jgi:hypothetical protein
MTGIRSSFVLLALLAMQAIAYAQTITSPAEPRRPTVVAVDQTTPQPAGDSSVRQRADDLATQATGRFNEILSDGKASPSDAAPPGDEVFAPLWGWLSRASSDYRDVIVAKLKNSSGDIVVIAPPGGTQLAQATEPPAAPRTEPAPEPQRGLSWATIVEGVLYWLAQTNSSYRTEIVKELAREAPKGTGVAEGNTPVTPPGAQSPPPMGAMTPQAGVEPSPQPMTATAPAASPAPSPSPTTNPAPAAAPEPQRTGDAADQASQDTAAKSRDEEIKRISEAEDGKRRAAEERRLAEAEAQRKAQADKAAADKAEAKRKAEAAEAEAEAEEAEDRAAAKRREEAAEAERKAEAKRRAEVAEAERKAESKRAAEAAEAKRKAAEEKRVAEAAEAKRKAEEKKRRAEAAEAERKAEVKREADAAEAKRKAADEKRAADAAESKRKAEEKKRLAEEAAAEQKAVEDAARLAQAETKSAPEAPAKIPAADTPTKQSKPAAQDDGRKAADERSEPAQSAPVVPKVEKRTARSAKQHGKKRVQKSRRKVTKAHYRGGRKVRRKAYRTRRYRHDLTWSDADARVYVVRRGDTLSAIAKRYYGSGSAYRAIYKANRDRVHNPHVIYPRQRLYIPHRRRHW